jgi:cell division protein FtsZ
MSIKLQLPKLTDLKPRITVVGVGGAGGNAINNMISSGLDGVDFIVANTDAQALAASSAERRIQLGVNLTEGLGAGSKPEIGMAAAEEALDEIRTQIAGSHMVFIAAGMGGGTGTGAAAVIARIARELDVLTVGIVTKPFQFEGSRRMRAAEAGIAELKKYVDTLIVIPNQNLFRIASERTTFAEAFLLADQVLYAGIACIVDLIVRDGLINLDFADVRTVMKGMGSAMMGTGEAEGDRRAVRAAEEAIANPLLDNVTLEGAKAVLLSIIGGEDMTLYEVDEAASRVRQEVDAEANIIVGATFDARMGDRVRVAIVASGMREESAAMSALPNAPAMPRVGPPPLPQSTDRGPDAMMRGARFGEPMAQGMPHPPQGRPGRYEAGPNDPMSDHPPYGFEAPQPEDHPRGGRRMPRVIDFPNVGQREYSAKMAQYTTAQANARGEADDHEARGRSWAGGLLRRLIGGGANQSGDRRGKNIGENLDEGIKHHDSGGSSQPDLPKFFSRYRA